MALVAYDETDKLHTDLLDTFKRDLMSDIYSKDHLYCQYYDVIDEIHLVLCNMAVDELEADFALMDFDDLYWTASIYDNNPKSFGIIAGLEYINYETDEPDMEYVKLYGQILVEDDKLILWDIEPSSLDFSSRKEFEKARQTYSFRI